MSPAPTTPNRAPLRLAVMVGALGLAALVSGCGKVGMLEQPAPLFGERARERYDAEQAQRQRDAADKVGRTSNSNAVADVRPTPRTSPTPRRRPPATCRRRSRKTRP